jgi:exopolysaccharide biosynthesis protein
VEVNRVSDEENTVTYYTAEIRLGTGETERGGFSTPNRPGGKSTDLFKIAQYYKAVIAVNGDFLDHHPEDPKGVIIRDGEVFADDDKEDTAAFYPNGTMRVFEAGEITADELLADGVKNAFSFGPTLIRDGVIRDGLNKHYLRGKNPRTAVGMIEPNHFVLVVVEGRSSRSDGMTLVELAELFASYGCEVAYNLDGGQSATMAFMGEHISEYKGSLTGQRPVPDALMFGTSELVTGAEG